MDYRYWSRFLEPDEFRKWEVETLMKFDESKFTSNYRHFENFIRESFNPHDTKDGYGYWSDIIWRVERQLIGERLGYRHPFGAMGRINRPY
jgi:hypothetical protein